MCTTRFKTEIYFLIQNYFAELQDKVFQMTRNFKLLLKYDSYVGMVWGNGLHEKLASNQHALSVGLRPRMRKPQPSNLVC